MKTLSDGQVGKAYKILRYNGAEDGVLRRFMELGFCSGQSIKIVATSLMKKVFLIEIRGYLLSVRANLLQKIEVEA
ncbi:MAG: FeoA family protein [Candidatus Caccovivens sp.]